MSTAATTIHYRIDLAKGPTKCHGASCEEGIGKGCARVGVKHAPQELYYSFYHVRCFLSSESGGRPDPVSLPGFANLPQPIQGIIATSGAADLPKDIRVGPKPTLVRTDDFIGRSDKQTVCNGCSEYILTGQVNVGHFEVTGGNKYTLLYHVPCWLKVDATNRDIQKTFSQYEGYDQLPQCLRAQVLGPDPPKDLRVDPSSPAPMTKPKMKTPPKRCMANTKYGARCRWNSNSKHPKAAPLLQKGRYTCAVHKDVKIPEEEVLREERKRRVDPGIKQLQYFMNEEKRAQTSSSSSDD